MKGHTGHLMIRTAGQRHRFVLLKRRFRVLIGWRCRVGNRHAHARHDLPKQQGEDKQTWRFANHDA